MTNRPLVIQRVVAAGTWPSGMAQRMMTESSPPEMSRPLSPLNRTHRNHPLCPSSTCQPQANDDSSNNV